VDWNWVGPAVTIVTLLAVGWVTLRTQSNKAAEKAKNDTLAIVSQQRDELLALSKRQQGQIEQLQRDSEEKDRRITLLTSMVTKSSEIENLGLQLRGYHEQTSAHLVDIKGLLGGQRDGEPAA
jgi:hypothetical protein